MATNTAELERNLATKAPNRGNPIAVRGEFLRWFEKPATQEKMGKLLGLEKERYKELFMLMVFSNPKLMQSDPSSLCEAFMRCAMTKLLPGMEVSLLTFWNKKKGANDVVFVPQYGALIKLALQSGFIKAVWSEVVCEKDEFDVEEGLYRKLHHKKARVSREQRGARVAVYACYEGVYGNHEFHVLWPEEVMAIKKRSTAGDSDFSPWNGDKHGNFTDTDWMWKKCAIKQLLKTVPKSIELNRALLFDNEAEVPESKKKPIVNLDDMYGLDGSDVIEPPEGATPEDGSSESDPNTNI